MRTRKTPTLTPTKMRQVYARLSELLPTATQTPQRPVTALPAHLALPVPPTSGLLASHAEPATHTCWR